jgi:hypothetical protein
MERESSLAFLLNAKLTCLITTLLDFFCVICSYFNGNALLMVI